MACSEAAKCPQSADSPGTARAHIYKRELPILGVRRIQATQKLTSRSGWRLMTVYLSVSRRSLRGKICRSVYEGFKPNLPLLLLYIKGVEKEGMGNLEIGHEGHLGLFLIHSAAFALHRRRRLGGYKGTSFRFPYRAIGYSVLTKPRTPIGPSPIALAANPISLRLAVELGSLKHLLAARRKAKSQPVERFFLELRRGYF